MSDSYTVGGQIDQGRCGDTIKVGARMTGANSTLTTSASEQRAWLASVRPRIAAAAEHDTALFGVLARIDREIAFYGGQRATD